MVASLARPSGPCEGSLTSIREAPQRRAIAASLAVRTLTRSWTRVFSSGLDRELDIEKAHPPGALVERQRREVGEYEAIQHRRLVPGELVKVLRLIQREGLGGAIVEALQHLSLADDAADHPCGLQQFRGH